MVLTLDYVSLYVMKFPKFILAIVIFCMVLFSCRTGTRKDRGSEVHFYGNIDSIMAGEYPVVFNLDSLVDKQNIYALGTMENLAGEIQIFNSQPYHSTAENDSLIVGSAETQNASLLVYAQVSDWKEISMPLSVVNQEALVGFLEYDEVMSEISSDAPLVFTIEGKAEEIEWHVLTGKANDSTHGDQRHNISSVSGVLHDVDVEILGFYSREHEGVFTHHNLPLHLHFKTADGRIAGHLDNLELGQNMTMRIPKNK